MCAARSVNKAEACEGACNVAHAAGVANRVVPWCFAVDEGAAVRGRNARSILRRFSRLETAVSKTWHDDGHARKPMLSRSLCVRRLCRRTHLQRLCSSASVVRLLTPSEAATLAPSSALQLTVKVPADDNRHVRLLDIFVARGADGAIAAYENHCPHAGGPLNMLPDRFFTRDGAHLICMRHGARFSPTDGECVHGPCAGEALSALPVDSDQSGAIVARWSALRHICVHGGGAYVLREATSDDARVPAVTRAESSPLPRRAPRRGQSG